MYTHTHRHTHTHTHAHARTHTRARARTHTLLHNREKNLPLFFSVFVLYNMSSDNTVDMFFSTSCCRNAEETPTAIINRCTTNLKGPSRGWIRCPRLQHAAAYYIDFIPLQMITVTANTAGRLCVWHCLNCISMVWCVWSHHCTRRKVVYIRIPRCLRSRGAENSKTSKPLALRKLKFISFLLPWNTQKSEDCTYPENTPVALSVSSFKVAFLFLIISRFML